MILEGGTIRTLDPQLPLVRALAVAGDRIAGATGTHERALPSPERVDLQGAWVVPGLTARPLGFLRWARAEQGVEDDPAQSVAALRAAAKSAHARGVTTVHDCDGWRSVAGWQQLLAEGTLTLRVRLGLPLAQVVALQAVGLRAGFGSEWLSLGFALTDGLTESERARVVELGWPLEASVSERLEPLLPRQGQPARLLPGRPADLVVLAGDPLGAEELPSLLATMVAGRWVYLDPAFPTSFDSRR